ncbi:MAG: type II toxin-antitoxin system HicB family antitoxin [Dehalococcoidia bacterium]
MKNEFTAIVEPAEEGGFWAYCLEVPGANGQGETMEEVLADLAAAIELMLDYLREKGSSEASVNAERKVVTVVA